MNVVVTCGTKQIDDGLKDKRVTMLGMYVSKRRTRVTYLGNKHVMSALTLKCP